MDGRIVGTITATVLLIVLGFVALGLYTSLPGLLIAGSLAAIGGAAIAALAEPARSGRNAVVVAAYIAILILGYILVGQTAPLGLAWWPGRDAATVNALCSRGLQKSRQVAILSIAWVGGQQVIPNLHHGP